MTSEAKAAEDFRTLRDLAETGVTLENAQASWSAEVLCRFCL